MRLSAIKDILAHGVEARARVVTHPPDSGTVTFEYSILGRPHKSSKHVFGRQTLPDLSVGKEVDLIVHEGRPDKFLIRDQYV
jgi:hypothetical protein